MDWEDLESEQIVLHHYIPEHEKEDHTESLTCVCMPEVRFEDTGVGVQLDEFRLQMKVGRVFHRAFNKEG